MAGPPARYIFTGLVSVGLAIIYGLKVNLSVAIVAMINNTALTLNAADDDHHGNHHGSNETNTVTEFACLAPDTGNKTISIQDGPFAWPEPVQGLVLGSYFWGYIFTQIPGGRIAEMFSAKWVVWGAVIINVVFTLFTPVAAYTSYIAVLVVRFVEGLGAGVSLPAIHVMLSKWAPPKERNVISSLAYAGMALGTVISLPFSGILADLFGWESVFYVQGGLAFIWCILWIFFAYDSPQQHPRIDPAELELFESSMDRGGHGHANLPVPWKALWTSAPFWGILIAHTCNNFGWYMLLVELPTYMKHILRFNISENSLLSAVPYLSLWVFSLVWSNLLDLAKSKGWLTTTSVRKISTGVASLLPALCFVGVSFAGCDRNFAVALMTLGTMFMAGMYCGFLSNHIDIASNYAGTLMAITNTFATIPGFIVPVFVGELTHGNQSLDRWQIIFFTTAAIMLVEFLVFTTLGSGEEQTWNRTFTSGIALKDTAEHLPEAEALNKKNNDNI
nr:EOG090X04X8 [Polyphemus pediculus]